jgi:hypothetical protein
MTQAWVGRFDDPLIKKVNFIKGNQVVADGEGKDYFAEFEEKIKEENEKREREMATLTPNFVGFPVLTVKGTLAAFRKLFFEMFIAVSYLP